MGNSRGFRGQASLSFHRERKYYLKFLYGVGWRLAVEHLMKVRADRDEVTELSNYVEGSTLSNMTVQMELDGKKYTCLSSLTGKFRFKIVSHSAGKIVQVFATDNLNQKISMTTSKILRMFPYFSFSDKITEMKGRGCVGVQINIVSGKKLIWKATIDKKEGFLIKLPKMKKGTILKIEVSKKDYQTRSLTIKVN